MSKDPAVHQRIDFFFLAIFFQGTIYEGCIPMEACGAPKFGRWYRSFSPWCSYILYSSRSSSQSNFYTLHRYNEAIKQADCLTPPLLFKGHCTAVKCTNRLDQIGNVNNMWPVLVVGTSLEIEPFFSLAKRIYPVSFYCVRMGCKQEEAETAKLILSTRKDATF